MLILVTHLLRPNNVPRDPYLQNEYNQIADPSVMKELKRMTREAYHQIDKVLKDVPYQNY